MRSIQSRRLMPVLFAAFVFVFMIAMVGYGQEAQSGTTSTVQVPAGQKLEIEGVILGQQEDTISVRSTGGAVYNVSLANNPEVKEKKSNPFRGAKRFSKADLVPGLQVEVKGLGNDAGALAAREIKFRHDDFKVAQTMDTRVVPVESELTATKARLGEAEQNAQRLSGQVQELAAVSNAARGGAKAAQETADNAMSAANNAQSIADLARSGVDAANDRISSLDDYDVKNSTVVHFKAGSAILSPEVKAELERLAEQTKVERGFLIEVAGFASSDGNEAFNRRLSQRRADAVIQYLAEKYSIPLRRFVPAMGYGESQPVADNSTREGRKENRRVEVRVLVSKGLAQSEGTSTMNMPESNQQ